jgi:type I restriction-modification system DNA methylase subunit/restriction endonuclease S subunit
LFIYHVPALCASGHLELDTAYIGDGKLTEISYKSLLSLKEPTLINTAFKRLWKQLQTCVLKPLFEGRDFVMFSIEKKYAKKYMALLLELMTYIASVELERYDSNAGYTYFKKELNKAIAKTFGQFYTPSTVTASVVKQVDPKTGESVLDPSSGSCSFLAEAANHIAKSEGVDMAVAFKDLYGTEVEPNIYAEGVMNMFINFGILPDMNERIREVDALLDMATNTTLFKKIVANPPFGADARSFLEFYYQTVIEPPTGKAKKGVKKTVIEPPTGKAKKGVKKTVLNPEVKCEIPFPKISESAILFFQYIVQKLAPGGKAGVVMSATIFNDGFKDMMKWFLECCSLEKVIINPAGTFKEQGTGIETFSFIFTKGSRTTKVDIVMLGTEEEVVRSLTIDQIKEAGWKLQLKEEEKKVEYTGVYELKKLGDLCVVSFGERITKGSNEGTLYPVYGSGEDTFRTDKFNRSGKTCKLARFAVSEKSMVIFVNATYWLMDSGFTVDTKDSSVLYREYLWWMLMFDRKRLVTCAEGSCQKNIEMSEFYNLNYQIPPIPIQQEIVATLDRIFADIQDMKDCLAFTNKAMDLMLKDPSGKLLEDVMVGLRLKRSHQVAAASIKAQMAAVMRSLGGRGYEKKKLGDMCSFVNGHAFKSEEFTNTGIPVIKIKNIKNNIINIDTAECVTENEGLSRFIVKDNDMVISLTGELSGDVGLNTTGVNCYLNQRTARIDVTSDMIMSKYLYYYTVYSNFVLDVRELSSGSAQPNVSTKKIEELQIPIPPLPIQQEVLTILNEMESEVKVMEQMAVKAEQRAKYILDGYLSTQSKVEPVATEPVAIPVNTLVTTEAPAPVRRVLGKKK